MKKVGIVISPNYKDYGKKYLRDCADSIRSQDYNGEIKIYITDNETTEESFSFLKRELPEARIHKNKANDGFAKGNNDAIRQALKEECEYIILFNMDTVVAPDCVRKMVKAADSDADIGAVQARLMLYGQKDTINSLGNTTHFLGFGYCLAYREKYEGQEGKLREIHYPSGAAVLFKSEALERAGLYEEDYWMYNEDQEHGWRLWLAGLKCVLAPEAVVYHKYEFAKSIRQYYWMDRNRIISILSCYHFLTLFLIAPAFFAMEAGLLIFSIKNGWFWEKIRVWNYFLNAGNWKRILKRRRRNQDLREVSDRRIIRLLSGRIWYQEIDDWKLRFINPIFEIYWKIIRVLIIW